MRIIYFVVYNLLCGWTLALTCFSCTFPSHLNRRIATYSNMTTMLAGSRRTGGS